MADKDHMPKFNLEKDGHKISAVEKEYMQRLGEQNLLRVQKWNRVRRRNRFLGTFLGLSVVSIYSYTMWAIKQESFLDDFNEPEKISD